MLINVENQTYRIANSEFIQSSYVHKVKEPVRFYISKTTMAIIVDKIANQHSHFTDITIEELINIFKASTIYGLIRLSEPTRICLYELITTNSLTNLEMVALLDFMDVDMRKYILNAMFIYKRFHLMRFFTSLELLEIGNKFEIKDHPILTIAEIIPESRLAEYIKLIDINRETSVHEHWICRLSQQMKYTLQNVSRLPRSTWVHVVDPPTRWTSFVGDLNLPSAETTDEPMLALYNHNVCMKVKLSFAKYKSSTGTTLQLVCGAQIDFSKFGTITESTKDICLEPGDFIMRVIEYSRQDMCVGLGINTFNRTETVYLTYDENLETADARVSGETFDNLDVFHTNMFNRVAPLSEYAMANNLKQAIMSPRYLMTITPQFHNVGRSQYIQHVESWVFVWNCLMIKEKVNKSY